MVIIQWLCIRVLKTDPTKGEREGRREMEEAKEREGMGKGKGGKVM